MEKVLQKLFWAPIPFKRYQNTSGCGTVYSKHKFFNPKEKKP